MTTLNDCLKAVEDLLVEFDEMDFVPRNTLPGQDPVEVAKAWKELLIKTLMDTTLPTGEAQNDIHCEAIRISCYYMNRAVEARVRARDLSAKMDELQDTLERRKYEDGKRVVQEKKRLVRNVLSDIKKEVHTKATFTHAKDTYAFINLSTFDEIVREEAKVFEDREDTVEDKRE